MINGNIDMLVLANIVSARPWRNQISKAEGWRQPFQLDNHHEGVKMVPTCDRRREQMTPLAIVDEQVMKKSR